MLAKLVEVYKVDTNNYNLREIYVNPAQVVMVVEDPVTKIKLHEGQLPEDLDQRVEFSSMQLSTGDNLTVVGEVFRVKSALGLSSRDLLRG
jgi:hypothetical protein